METIRTQSPYLETLRYEMLDISKYSEYNGFDYYSLSSRSYQNSRSFTKNISFIVGFNLYHVDLFLQHCMDVQHDLFEPEKIGLGGTKQYEISEDTLYLSCLHPSILFVVACFSKALGSLDFGNHPVLISMWARSRHIINLSLIKSCIIFRIENIEDSDVKKFLDIYDPLVHLHRRSITDDDISRIIMAITDPLIGVELANIDCLMGERNIKSNDNHLSEKKSIVRKRDIYSYFENMTNVYNPGSLSIIDAYNVWRSFYPESKQLLSFGSNYDIKLVHTSLHHIMLGCKFNTGQTIGFGSMSIKYNSVNDNFFRNMFNCVIDIQKLMEHKNLLLTSNLESDGINYIELVCKHQYTMKLFHEIIRSLTQIVNSCKGKGTSVDSNLYRILFRQTSTGTFNLTPTMQEFMEGTDNQNYRAQKHYVANVYSLKLNGQALKNEIKFQAKNYRIEDCQQRKQQLLSELQERAIIDSKGKTSAEGVAILKVISFANSHKDMPIPMKRPVKPVNNGKGTKFTDQKLDEIISQVGHKHEISEAKAKRLQTREEDDKTNFSTFLIKKKEALERNKAIDAETHRNQRRLAKAYSKEEECRKIIISNKDKDLAYMKANNIKPNDYLITSSTLLASRQADAELGRKKVLAQRMEAQKKKDEMYNSYTTSFSTNSITEEKMQLPQFDLQAYQDSLKKPAISKSNPFPINLSTTTTVSTTDYSSVSLSSGVTVSSDKIYSLPEFVEETTIIMKPKIVNQSAPIPFSDMTAPQFRTAKQAWDF